MARITVTINGKEYPCQQTMGAMLRFKRETGREVTEISPESLSDLCTYLYCCVASACAAEGTPLELSLMDFADGLAPDALAVWAESLNGDAAPAGGGTPPAGKKKKG